MVVFPLEFFPGEEKLEKGNRLYKPTSKLSDKKAASTPLAKPTKTKEEEKPERPVI